MRCSTITLVCLASLAFATPARSGVIVVGPGLVHDQIGSGVARASDGDVVLVKAGFYEKFTIDSKGIAVVAEVGAHVVTHGIEIRNVAAGKTVVLDRLISLGEYGALGFLNGLNVTNCGGAIRAQGCEFLGAFGSAYLAGCSIVGQPDGQDGVRIVSSTNVSFTGCKLDGGIGSSLYTSDFGCYGNTWNGGYGGEGLRAVNATVTLYDSECQGGSSGTGSYSKQGGHGIELASSSAVLVNVVSHGGWGGDSLDGFASSPGGTGGNAMYLDATSVARVLDSSFDGGTQGSGVGHPGGAVAPAIGGNGAVMNWPGTSKNFGSFKLVREGQTLVLQIAGSAGEAALLFASPRTTAILAPQAKGVFCLDPLTLIGPLSLGVITGTAPISVNIPIPSLPAGILGAEVYLQGVLVGPSGATLTTWGHVTILDSSL